LDLSERAASCSSDDINTSDHSDSSDGAMLDGSSFHHSDELPDEVYNLRKELLGDYKLPATPPVMCGGPQTLSKEEETTLEHYIAWNKSRGTVKAYEMHARVLTKASGINVLSLYEAKKLTSHLTGLMPNYVDMCRSSCIAYTGKYKDLNTCPYIHKGVLCGKERYKHRVKPTAMNKPHAQVMILPIKPTIQALYANVDTSRLLRDRDNLLKQALHLIGTAAAATKTFSDFGDSQMHTVHHKHLNLFQDSRDIAFALSTDGAQLTMKKQSNTWLVILIILNLPGELRYKENNTIIPFATPGPHSPGDIESFLYPVFQEMSTASEGLWIWDAVDSSYFVFRASICMALGDMLGSAKLNGMAGHTAICGDRFSLVKGARATLQKGKAQYYPISPPDNAKKEYNPTQPTYSFENLPI